MFHWSMESGVRDLEAQTLAGVHNLLDFFFLNELCFPTISRLTSTPFAQVPFSNTLLSSIQLFNVLVFIFLLIPSLY